MQQSLVTEDTQLTPPNPLTKDQMVKLSMIQEKIDFLYDQKKAIIQEVLTGHYSVSNCTKIDGLDKPWMRVTLTDNLNVFKDQDAVFRMATINRYESKIEFLKNEPKAKE
jgi:hypothetical protein